MRFLACIFSGYISCIYLLQCGVCDKKLWEVSWTRGRWLELTLIKEECTSFWSPDTTDNRHSRLAWYLLVSQWFRAIYREISQKRPYNQYIHKLLGIDVCYGVARSSTRKCLIANFHISRMTCNYLSILRATFLWEGQITDYQLLCWKVKMKVKPLITLTGTLTWAYVLLPVM